MCSQITEKNSYKLKLPLQIVQLYLLTVALGNYYCYDIAHESREYKKRQCNLTPTFAERIQYSLYNFCFSFFPIQKLSFELAKIARCIDFYEGVGIPGRFESESDIGFLDLVMNLQEELYSRSLIGGFDLTTGCLQWIEKAQDGDSSIFRVQCSLYVAKPEWNKENIYYCPTLTESIARFSTIQNKSQCIFAKASRNWSAPDWDYSLGIESNIARSVNTLSRFVISGRYEHLDGFVFEFPEDLGYGKSPLSMARLVRILLSTLTKLDPCKVEIDLDDDSISNRMWQFTFNRQRIFVTSFAPCYPETSPRYTFGSQSAWVLMQPEYSFSYHEVDVFHENHKSAREKVRKSFRKHNRPYHIPTRNDLMAHIYVRPLDDVNDTPIDWWNVPLIDEVDDNGEKGEDVDSDGKLIIDI